MQSGPPRLFEMKDGKLRSHSLSGNERNRLKLQRDGNFVDVALISGGDFKQDGRCFVLFDYDNDGWQDLAIASCNSPRLRILRNQIGDLIESANQPKKRVSIELVGGNTSAEPTVEWSARDGYGAKIFAKFGDTTRAFSYACSEGLSGQNSRKLHISMGQNESISELLIVWPSGKSSTLKNIEAGEELVIHENENAKTTDQ